MGLLQTFRARTVLPYRLFDEQLAPVTESCLRPVAIWAGKPPIAPSDTPAVFVLPDADDIASLRLQVYGITRGNPPSDGVYGIDWWRMNLAEGDLPSRGANPDLPNLPNLSPPAYTPTAVGFTVEPGDMLWRFGGFEDEAFLGPVGFDPYTWAPLAYLNLTDFGLAAHTADFAIDRRNDRVYVRLDVAGWDVRKVSIYRRSDHSHVGDIWAPGGATAGIIPTGDGRVFLMDSYDWIAQYSQDGGACQWMTRNPRPAGVFHVYGWDRRYNRLLELDATAVDGDGHSTLRVRGFVPVPCPVHLTTPAPTSPPRRYDRTDYLAHLCDDGGLGVSSHLGRRFPLGGPVSSDAQGDFLLPLEPSAAGTYSIGVTVLGRTRVVGSARIVLSTLTPYQILVQSTAMFAASGTLKVQSTNGIKTVTYTSKTDESFEGCLGGDDTNTLFAGAEVTQ